MKDYHTEKLLISLGSKKWHFCIIWRRNRQIQIVQF